MGADVVLESFRRAQCCQVPGRKLSAERLKPFLQRSGCISEIQETKAFPKTKPRRLQRIFRLVESWHLIHVRRAKQSPIERVRPRVIGALNCSALSVSAFDEATTAVAAHIVKAMDLSAFISDNDEAL